MTIYEPIPSITLGKAVVVVLGAWKEVEAGGCGDGSGGEEGK